LPEVIDKPLAGYRVADFSSIVAGPWCTRLLADCGARVVKVETPGMGDVLRFAPPIADGQSRTFAHFNCGKESIAIDLKAPAGVEAARRLIRASDIVVENFRPGVMQRLGLDYATVSADHPTLIYCAISGFGQTGPDAHVPAYAPVVQAQSGFDHVWQIAQDADAPLNAAIMVADFQAAAYAFGAVQTAVVRRERFGVGAFLDVTLMESMISMVAIQCQEAQWDSDIRSNVFRPVAVRDGHVMIPLVSHRNYVDLLSVMKHPLRDDQRMRSYEGVLSARAEILRNLADWASGMSAEEVVACMHAAGLPCARYRKPAEVLEDRHLSTRGSFSALEDARGSYVVCNAPFRFGAEPLKPGGTVPRLGEHNGSVLEELGFSPDEIAAMGGEHSVMQ
jgi:CoA:oxalate CoA-transferase